MENIQEYYNLIENDLTDLQIEEVNEYLGKQYRCVIKDNKGKEYKGFLLAKSNKGCAYTLCEINIQRSATDDKYHPRFIFRRTDEELQNKKVFTGNKYQRISFNSGQDGYREFWEMVAFLYKFRELIDIGEAFEEYKVVDSSKYIQEFDTQEEVEQVKTLKKLIRNADLSEDRIKEIISGAREKTLKEFKKLLVEKTYWKTYLEKNENEIAGTGEEAVWHHFLKKHDWILGLNADVRFIRDFVDEAEVGIPNTEGKGSPVVDMMGLSDYTVLIELKKPSTHIFTEHKKESTSRANTWSFTDHFIDGISQCLAQKTEWDEKHKSKELVLRKKVVDQNHTRSLDTKTIFLIGNKEKEIPTKDSDVETLLKRDTFQRYRRNSRNINIVTYDELYERAYFIVYGKKENVI